MADSKAKGAASQTLSRGLQILELLDEAPGSLTIDDVAAALAVHRSVAYRLIRTLEDHGFVGRREGGGLVLGARLAALAGGVERDLQAVAVPELTLAARDLGMTCFLGVRDRDECLTLSSVEPPKAIAVVAQRPGTSHPLRLGAPGKVILAQTAEHEWPSDVTDADREQVRLVRERGWVETADEVITGLRSVGVPLNLRGGRAAAVATVFVGDGDPRGIAERLQEVAEAIQRGAPVH
ncbi:IclR family transcriptional regulator [Kocuria sp. HSID16901]|uniref:IclR family transcriptional regulator n=1 Tax=Kocuria sp. HSID16901 TaxID=2419505 RepID=UPI000660E45E|nr:helix-turn-helix domain-containing protein [Kocuria sp. HSID16901]RUQ19897.1 ArsR family transcriptional regulator [Kocuria sp. HSID16901]